MEVNQPRGRLIIMRGVPGSGKTTMAKQLKKRINGRVEIYSSDDFFMKFDKFSKEYKYG